ncbi:hypothetical protein D3C80_1540700 [compost metagenome]
MALALLAHCLHHLAHHVLRTLAQRIQCIALTFNGTVTLTLAQRLTGTLHFLLCLAKTFTGLHAKVFQALLQFAQLLAKCVLLGAQLFQGFAQLLCRHLVSGVLALTLLLLVALLALLALLLFAVFALLLWIAALHAVTQGLVELECLIHQLLLLLHDFAQLVDLLTQLAVLLILLSLLRTSHLQVVHHALKL